METAASETTEHVTGAARRGIRSLLAPAISACVLLGACGGDSRADEASEPAATTPTASSAADADRSATTATTSANAAVDTVATDSTARKPDEIKRDKADKPEAEPTTTTTSVAPPPPTTVPLPQPIAPPVDDEAPEPVVPLGTLAIPAIGIEPTFYEGIRLPTFDLGPGHWPGTAMPGQTGNMVIGGHRTEGNADFGNLDQLGPGDEMIMTTNDGASFTYLVESVEITDPFASRVIHQTPEKTATLFACHPPGSVRQRIVVHLSLSQP